MLEDSQKLTSTLLLESLGNKYHTNDMSNYTPQKKNLKESTLNSGFELDLNEVIYGSTGYEVLHLDDDQILGLSQHDDIDIVDGYSILKSHKKKENTEKELILIDQSFNTDKPFIEFSQQNSNENDMPLNSPVLETTKSDIYEHPNLQNFNCNIEGKYSKKKKSPSIINTLISLSETLRIRENDLDILEADSEDQILVDKKTLKRLIDLVMNSKPVQAIAKKDQLYCGFCLLKFESQSNLYKHLSSYHLKGNYKEKDAENMCQICKKTFASKNVLDQHELSHLDWKNYICALCGLRFIGAQSFLTHMKSHLNGEEINYLTCLECNIDFKTELLFESHIKNEHNWRNVVLSTTSQLQINEITSTQDAAQNKQNIESIFFSDYFIFRCNKCCKCFNNNESVVAHMNLVHKNILCKQCDIFFSYMTDYDQHMADHLAGELFECSICKMHFPSSESLQHHFDSKHTHSEEFSSIIQPVAPLQCKLCLEKFVNIQDIWIHANYHFSKQDNILSVNEILGKSKIVPSEDHFVDSFKLFALSLHKSNSNECNLFTGENHGVICVFCHSIMPTIEHNSHVYMHMYMPSFNFMKPSLRELTSKSNNLKTTQKKLSSKLHTKKKKKKGLRNLNNQGFTGNDEFVNNLLSTVDLTLPKIVNILMGEQDNELPKSEVLNNLHANSYLQSISNENFNFFPDESNRNFKSYYDLLEGSHEEQNIESNYPCGNYNEEIPKDMSWIMNSGLNPEGYQPVLSGILQSSLEKDCRNNLVLSENDFHKITKNLNFVDLIESSTKDNDHFGKKIEDIKTGFVRSSDIPVYQLENTNKNKPLTFDLTNGVDKFSKYCDKSKENGCQNSSSLDVAKLERIYENSKKYVCKFCSYSSNNTQHIKEHTNSHTGERPYKCNECTISYTSKTALRRHCYSKHKNIEKKFKCDECEYKTYQQSTLNIHKRIHLTENHLKCDKCKYNCYSKARLEQHIRSHIGFKPYKCKFCNTKYSNKYYAISHESKCQSMNSKKLKRSKAHTSLNRADMSYIVEKTSGFADEALLADQINSVQFLSNQSIENYLQSFDPNNNVKEIDFTAESFDNTSFEKHFSDSFKILSANELSPQKTSFVAKSQNHQLDHQLVHSSENPVHNKLQQAESKDNNKGNSITNKTPKRKILTNINDLKKRRRTLQPGDKEKTVDECFEPLQVHLKISQLEKTSEMTKVRRSTRRIKSNLPSFNSNSSGKNSVCIKASIERSLARKTQSNVASLSSKCSEESSFYIKPSIVRRSERKRDNLPSLNAQCSNENSRCIQPSLDSLTNSKMNPAKVSVDECKVVNECKVVIRSSSTNIASPLGCLKNIRANNLFFERNEVRRSGRKPQNHLSFNPTNQTENCNKPSEANHKGKIVFKENLVYSRPSKTSTQSNLNESSVPPIGFNANASNKTLIDKYTAINSSNKKSLLKSMSTYDTISTAISSEKNTPDIVNTIPLKKTPNKFNNKFPAQRKSIRINNSFKSNVNLRVSLANSENSLKTKSCLNLSEFTICIDKIS